MQIQNCTKHSPARQGEECPKCQIDHLRAVNAELLEALENFFREQDAPTSTDGFEIGRGRADAWVNLRSVYAKHRG